MPDAAAEVDVTLNGVALATAAPTRKRVAHALRLPVPPAALLAAGEAAADDGGGGDVSPWHTVKVRERSRLRRDASGSLAPSPLHRVASR